MAKHDWYIGFELDIIDLYNRGFGANSIIEKLQLNVSDPKTLHRFLRRHGIEIRKFDERLPTACLACNTVFEKDSWNRKLCLTCAPTKVWYARWINYGITKPQFDEQWQKQSGLCDLCEEPLDYEGKVCVDHCHKQGHYRGLLHNKCNIGLHYIENDKFFSAAIRYIEKHRR